MADETHLVCEDIDEYEDDNSNDYNDLEVADYLARASRHPVDNSIVQESSCSSLGSHAMTERSRSSSIMTNVPRGNAAATMTPPPSHAGAWSISELAFRGELMSPQLINGIPDDVIDSSVSSHPSSSSSSSSPFSRHACTPLITSSACGWLHVVRTLLSHGACVDARDDRGATALMHAASAGHCDVLRSLLDYGADINATCSSGNTVLHYAVYGNHIPCVRLLLSAGSDMTIVNSSHLTPLALAARLRLVKVEDVFNRHVLALFSSRR